MDHLTFAQLLGNYGEFLGAIAVVLTLLYLATQIRVARIATSAQLEENVNSSWNREVRAWGENEEVAKLMAANGAKVVVKPSLSVTAAPVVAFGKIMHVPTTSPSVNRSTIIGKKTAV